MIGAKPLRVMFDKVDGFIRDSDGTKYLLLFGPEIHHVIFGRIIYLIGSKRYYICFSHNYVKIKLDLDDDLPSEKHWLCLMI